MNENTNRTVNSEPLKIAIIGCGGIGKLHAKAYEQIPGVKVEWMIDVVKDLADCAAAQFGAKALYNVDDLTEKPDIVDVVTPPNLHTAFTLKFVEQGIPVFCEKPLTTDVDEAKAVVAAADRYDVPVGIGFKMRNELIFIEAKKHIGKLGKLYAVSTVKNQPHHVTTPDHWTTKTGAMYELSVHEYDLINWITGLEPLDVSAELHYDFGWEKENRAFLNVHYTDDVTGQLFSSYSSDTTFTFSDLTMMFVGDKGYMRVERPNRIFLHTDRDEVIDVVPEDNFLATVAELRNFVEAVRTGTKPVPDVHNGAAMTLMVEAARKSSITGKREIIERP